MSSRSVLDSPSNSIIGQGQLSENACLVALLPCYLACFATLLDVARADSRSHCERRYTCAMQLATAVSQALTGWRCSHHRSALQLHTKWWAFCLEHSQPQEPPAIGNCALFPRALMQTWLHKCPGDGRGLGNVNACTIAVCVLTLGSRQQQ